MRKDTWVRGWEMVFASIFGLLLLTMLLWLFFGPNASNKLACFFWSQEAAGWAQFIGTMLAIGITHRVATSSERKREAEKSEGKILESVGQIMLLIISAHHARHQLGRARGAFNVLSSCDTPESLRNTLSAMRLESSKATVDALGRTEIFTKEFTGQILTFAQVSEGYANAVNLILQVIERLTDLDLLNSLAKKPGAVDIEEQLGVSKLLLDYAQETCTAFETAAQAELTRITDITWRAVISERLAE